MKTDTIIRNNNSIKKHNKKSKIKVMIFSLLIILFVYIFINKIRIT